MAEADFHASSSRGKALSLADFQGKVPVVLVFVGPLDPGSFEVADLDRHHVDFGRARVQLLVVAQADGADVRAVPFTGLDLPVLADPHGELRASFAKAEGEPAGSGGERQPAGSGGERQPAGSGGEGQPAGSGGERQPAGSGGKEEPGATHFAVVLDKQGKQVDWLPYIGGAEALLARVRDLGDRLHA